MSSASIEHNLRQAMIHHRAGRLDDAERLYREVLACQPDQAEALHLLGVLAGQQCKTDVAIELLRRSIACNPANAEPYSNLGNALRIKGLLREAVAACRQAIVLQPRFPGALSNLGVALTEDGQLGEAIVVLREAIALDPGYAEAFVNLGVALTENGQLDEAIIALRQALVLRPGFAEAMINLGNALREKGQLGEAVSLYRGALESDPDSAVAHSNLIFSLHYDPRATSRSIYQECLKYERHHGWPLRSFIRPFNNVADPDRLLRIGYVSPDLRNNVIGLFLKPLLTEHDHREYQSYCYADVRRPDEITRQLMRCADQWRSIVGLSDEQVAELVRKDGIDVLVDLSLHTRGNRLRVFARKPAPVQVTYLAYCGTSGLATMDWRISDVFLDPEASDLSCYSEMTWRLPDCFFCYEPVVETPAIAPLPADMAGLVTFGSLNHFCKVNDDVLAVWGGILAAVKGSRLILHSPEGDHRRLAVDTLVGAGAEAERIIFLPKQSIDRYFATYQQIDIALDPFPYNGGTTTLDALWMGVPVISLAGQTAMGRVGSSILSNIGLAELVAHDRATYLSQAVGLGNDLPRLRQLRATLRERMQDSPVTDAPRFARSMEAGYRQMWREWCARRGR
jgi:predicted O-linked N-acetylglucosamine transferase (SPINDLY family)